MGLVLTTPLSQRKPVSGRVSDQRVITCASCASNPHDIRPLTPAALPAYPPNRAPTRISLHPGPEPKSRGTRHRGFYDVSDMDRIHGRYKLHRHQLRKRKNRESCVSPLTTAKLTRSCADANAGAIMYTQFTTDIALTVNGRCKKLALEHHKVDRNANLRGPQCRLSCQALRHSFKGLEQRFPKGGLRACGGAILWHIEALDMIGQSIPNQVPLEERLHNENYRDGLCWAYVDAEA